MLGYKLKDMFLKILQIFELYMTDKDMRYIYGNEGILS